MESLAHQSEPERVDAAIVDRAFMEQAVASPEFFAAQEAAIQMAAREGDRRAFGLLVHYYGEGLRRYARGALRGTSHISAAEDVVQTTFGKVLERLDQPDIEERPVPRRPYFVRTLKTTIWDYTGSAYAARTDIADLTGPHLAETPREYMFLSPAAVSDPADLSNARLDARTLLRHLLSGITERRRLILTMRFMEDKSENQVAQEMGVSVATINQAVHIAMRQLRQDIADTGNTRT